MIERTGMRLRWSPWILVPVIGLLYVGSALRPSRVLLPLDRLVDEGPWKKDPAERVTVSNSLLSDPVHEFHPWDVAARGELAEGRLPWRNRFAAGGDEPLWANPQAAIFSPFTWPRIGFGVRGWAWSVLLKLVCAGLGMFAFARALGARASASAVSAVVYQLSGFEILWGLHPHTNVFSVLPWLALSALELSRRPSARWTLAIVGTAALATAGGHPETLALGVLGISAFLVLESRSGAQDGGGWSLVRVAAAGAAGFLLLSIQLVPFAVLLKESRFAGERAAAASGQFRAVAVMSQVLPGFLGSPLGSEIDLSGAFRGSENLNLRAGGFIGFLSLLALALTARRLPPAFRRGLLVGGIALVVSWKVPPLGWIWHHLPGIELFAPEYAVLVFVFFASLAAGPALESLSEAVPGRGVRAVAAILLVGGGLLALAGIFPALPAGRRVLDERAREGVARLRESGYLKADAETYERRMQGYVDRATTTAWRRLALPGLCWALAGSALLLRRRPNWLLACAALGELASFGYGYLPAVPVAKIPSEADAIAYLRARPPADRALIAASVDAYTADLPTLAGIRDVRSFSVLESGTYVDRLARCGYEPRYRVFPEVLSAPQAGCLANLGVRHYLSRHAQSVAPRVGGGAPPAVGVYELRDVAQPGPAGTGPPAGFRAGLVLTGLAAAASLGLMMLARRRDPDRPRIRAAENPGG